MPQHRGRECIRAWFELLRFGQGCYRRFVTSPSLPYGHVLYRDNGNTLDRCVTGQLWLVCGPRSSGKCCKLLWKDKDASQTLFFTCCLEEIHRSIQVSLPEKCYKKMLTI